MELIINVQNTADINILLPLFNRLGITFIEKKSKIEVGASIRETVSPVQINQLPITFAENPDFMAAAGIWVGKDITIEQLRQDAWGGRM
jgi:hypothetical protein